MKKDEYIILGVVVIAGIGFYLLSQSSAASMAANPTSATAAATAANAPATGVSGYLADASSAYNWLTGVGNNSGSTNSTSGVSSGGGVSTSNPASSVADDADDLYNYFD